MRMWGMRTETVPVIVGALELLYREGMDQNLGKIPGASNIKIAAKDHPPRNGAFTEKVSVRQIENCPDTAGPRINSSSRRV